LSDRFVGMVLSVRELRRLLEELGHRPRIIELRREGDAIMLDVEDGITGEHRTVRADSISGFGSFLLPHPSGGVTRVWYTGPSSESVDVGVRWMIGPSLLGKRVL